RASWGPRTHSASSTSSRRVWEITRPNESTYSGRKPWNRSLVPSRRRPPNGRASPCRRRRQKAADQEAGHDSAVGKGDANCLGQTVRVPLLPREPPTGSCHASMETLGRRSLRRGGRIMRGVTYAQLDKVLSAFGFTIRVATVENKLRVYEHKAAGARLALA